MWLGVQAERRIRSNDAINACPNSPGKMVEVAKNLQEKQGNAIKLLLKWYMNTQIGVLGFHLVKARVLSRKQELEIKKMWMVMGMSLFAVMVVADEAGLSIHEKINREWDEQDTIKKLDKALNVIPTNELQQIVWEAGTNGFAGLTNVVEKWNEGLAACNSDMAEARKIITQTKMDLEKARSFENSSTKVKLGYVSFAPYAIDTTDPANPFLSEGEAQGSAFLEVAFADRFAWRTDSGRKEGLNAWMGMNFWDYDKGKRRPWDWEAKLGFVFDNGTDANQANGSTIAAGGDIYGEVSAGYPLFYNRQPNALQFSIGPEVVATLVTQKNNFDINGNYKAVMAFVGRGADQKDKRTWQLLGRVGVGWVDVPQMVGSNNLVRVDSNNRPEFSHEFGTYMQVQFDLPVYETSTISLSGEFWEGLDINPWSTYISYSMSFTGIKNFLPFTKE